MSVLRRASPETLRTFHALRAAMSLHATRRGDRLGVRYGTGWISLRSAAAGRVFAEVRPGKKALEMFLLPALRASHDPMRLATPVPPSRGWGWFRTRIRVETDTSLSAIRELLVRSYEHARAMPRRTGKDPRARRLRRPG